MLQRYETRGKVAFRETLSGPGERRWAAPLRRDSGDGRA